MNPVCEEVHKNPKGKPNLKKFDAPSLPRKGLVIKYVQSIAFLTSHEATFKFKNKKKVGLSMQSLLIDNSIIVGKLF